MLLMVVPIRLEITQLIGLALLLLGFLQFLPIRSSDTIFAKVRQSMLFASVSILLLFIIMVLGYELFLITSYLPTSQASLLSTLHLILSNDLVIMLLGVGYVFVFGSNLYQHISKSDDIISMNNMNASTRLLIRLVSAIFVTIIIIPTSTINSQSHLLGLFHGTILSCILSLYILTSAFWEQWVAAAMKHFYITGSAFFVLGLLLIILG